MLTELEPLPVTEMLCDSAKADLLATKPTSSRVLVNKNPQTALRSVRGLLASASRGAGLDPTASVQDLTNVLPVALVRSNRVLEDFLMLIFSFWQAKLL